MQVDEIDFYNRLLNYRHILYLCHRNADPDAVSSAFALSEAIGGTVGLVDGYNRVASILIDRLNIDVVESPNPDDYEFTLIVDTSTSAQLNDIQLSRYGVIDHHATTALTEKADFYLHRQATSTAEIVFSVLKCMEAPVMSRVAIGLLTGIVTDTGHFKHATSETFKAVGEIVETSGVEYAEVLDLMASTPQDISMRIAMLKAASRAETQRTGDWLISTSHVSSFGGSAASMLINIGADVSFVGTSREDSTARISGRAKREAVNAGVNLGKIMEEVSEHYDGTGGGHAGAAGIDVNSDLDEILNECKMHVIDILKDQENPSNL
ncbi:phosphoesterase RecJ domain protein [Methanosalsum zhilinae DSM 4017]|uniref:Phosphoesterase RecJ domain protein n=1 Tax=Methanosalsum zhilinae (strain DSM 4017 / NBRC 107636 / OCM 62 / WeN5) TaxID=679901 RepID=F7XLT3_METZD|nr:DHHA1 domain-containing protein [Methanosalsum zhilinae]AEH61018.1 phosphoesterase RecJ domain protein [Methanosalsum zhilinae DSM 4017]